MSSGRPEYKSSNHKLGKYIGMCDLDIAMHEEFCKHVFDNYGVYEFLRTDKRYPYGDLSTIWWAWERAWKTSRSLAWEHAMGREK